LSAADLRLPASARGKLLLAVAARLGRTRLIDNLCLEADGNGRVEETLLF